MKIVRNIALVSLIAIAVIIIKLFVPKASSKSSVDYSGAINKKDSIEAILRVYPEKTDTICIAFIRQDPDLFNIIKGGLSKGVSIKAIDSTFSKDLEYLPPTIKKRIFKILETDLKSSK